MVTSIHGPHSKQLEHFRSIHSLKSSEMNPTTLCGLIGVTVARDIVCTAFSLDFPLARLKTDKCKTPKTLIELVSHCRRQQVQ